MRQIQKSEREKEEEEEDPRDSNELINEDACTRGKRTTTRQM